MHYFHCLYFQARRYWATSRVVQMFCYKIYQNFSSSWAIFSYIHWLIVRWNLRLIFCLRCNLVMFFFTKFEMKEMKIWPCWLLNGWTLKLNANQNKMLLRLWAVHYQWSFKKWCYLACWRFQSLLFYWQAITINTINTSLGGTLKFSGSCDMRQVESLADQYSR